MTDSNKGRIEILFNKADNLHSNLEEAKEMGLLTHREIEVYKMGIKDVYNELYKVKE